MGILNVTPDSFSDGGRYIDPEAAVAHGEEMAGIGADLIDIGGESTRPTGPYGEGAKEVSIEEEISRTVPVVQKLAVRIDKPISIDTTKAEVAKQALDAGASVVNDISAMQFDPEMPSTVAQAGVPIVLMHMQGNPRTMQENPNYRNLIGEIRSYLTQRRDAACAAGILPEQILIDPGIGFGKRPQHNFKILARLGEFHTLGCPLVVGPSRKSFLGVPPEVPPQDRLEGTLAALSFCVTGGAHVVRVHDVEAAIKAIRVAENTLKFSRSESY